MTIDRVGQFIEFVGDGGQRCIARVSAIQLATDVDECRDESFITVASRTILVRAPLDEVRDALLDHGGSGSYRSGT
jgi:hypothetical protein